MKIFIDDDDEDHDGDGDDDDDDHDGDGDDNDDDDDDDDDDADDDDDDDDVVEQTRTGPSAARSDLEHQVNHNAKISFFFTTFSAHTKKVGQQARVRRGVWPYFYYCFTCFLRICGRFSHVLLGVNITHFTCSNPYVLYLWYINPRLNAFEHFLRGRWVDVT